MLVTIFPAFAAFVLAGLAGAVPHTGYDLAANHRSLPRAVPGNIPIDNNPPSYHWNGRRLAGIPGIIEPDNNAPSNTENRRRQIKPSYLSLYNTQLYTTHGRRQAGTPGIIEPDNNAPSNTEIRRRQDIKPEIKRPFVSNGRRQDIKPEIKRPFVSNGRRQVGKPGNKNKRYPTNGRRQPTEPATELVHPASEGIQHTAEHVDSVQEPMKPVEHNIKPADAIQPPEDLVHPQGAVQPTNDHAQPTVNLVKPTDELPNPDYFPVNPSVEVWIHAVGDISMCLYPSEVLVGAPVIAKKCGHDMTWAMNRGTTYIRVRNTELCLSAGIDSNGSSSSGNGTVPVLAECSRSLYRPERTTPGDSLVWFSDLAGSIRLKGSDQCLEIDQDSTGTNVHTTTCNDNVSQHWAYVMELGLFPGSPFGLI